MHLTVPAAWIAVSRRNNSAEDERSGQRQERGVGVDCVEAGNCYEERDDTGGHGGSRSPHSDPNDHAYPERKEQESRNSYGHNELQGRTLDTPAIKARVYHFGGARADTEDRAVSDDVHRVLKNGKTVVRRPTSARGLNALAEERRPCDAREERGGE